MRYKCSVLEVTLQYLIFIFLNNSDIGVWTQNGRECIEWNKSVQSSGYTLEIIYLVSLFFK